MLHHLSLWAGAIAGLRVVDAFMAACAACAYRRPLGRLLRLRFEAKGTDVMGGGIALLSLGILAQTIFGLVLVATKGGVPADAVLWSRLMVGLSYAIANFGFTVIFAGMTTRAWLGQGLSLATAGNRGRLIYLRIATITGVTMTTGAALAMVHAA